MLHSRLGPVTVRPAARAAYVSAPGSSTLRGLQFTRLDDPDARLVQDDQVRVQVTVQRAEQASDRVHRRPEVKVSDEVGGQRVGNVDGRVAEQIEERVEVVRYVRPSVDADGSRALAKSKKASVLVKRRVGT